MDGERELPGEVHRVADARAHALAHEGRGLVRGVAGEEQPAPPPGVGDERVEGVDGSALELGLLGREPAVEQLPDPRRGDDLGRGFLAGSTVISQRRRFSGPRT